MALSFIQAALVKSIGPVSWQWVHSLFEWTTCGVMATVAGTGDVRGAVLEMSQRPFSPWSLETPHTGEAARTPEIRYTGACL